jgi:hypothetical protein
MISMTFGDETEEAWRLREAPAEPEEAANRESAWTPETARFVAAIAQALQSFPEALAAVQEAMARFREAPA